MFSHNIWIHKFNKVPFIVTTFAINIVPISTITDVTTQPQRFGRAAPQPTVFSSPDSASQIYVQMLFFLPSQVHLFPHLGAIPKKTWRQIHCAHWRQQVFRKSLRLPRIGHFTTSEHPPLRCTKQGGRGWECFRKRRHHQPSNNHARKFTKTSH